MIRPPFSLPRRRLPVDGGQQAQGHFARGDGPCGVTRGVSKSLDQLLVERLAESEANRVALRRVGCVESTHDLRPGLGMRATDAIECRKHCVTRPQIRLALSE